MTSKSSFLQTCRSPPRKGGWEVQRVRTEARRLGLDSTGTKDVVCNRIADKIFGNNGVGSQPKEFPPLVIPIVPRPVVPIVPQPIIPVLPQPIIPVVLRPLLSPIPPPPSTLLSLIPPPPRTLLSPPPTPVPQEENKCTFCCEVKIIRSRHNRLVPSYCGSAGGYDGNEIVCANCKSAKYDIEGDSDQQKFAREIFKDIVLDIEIKNIYTDMINRVNFSFENKFMTPEQRSMLINNINQYQQRYEEYIDDVINHNRYKPPAGSGAPYTYLTGSFDWAQAIIILRNWFVTHFQEEFQVILNSYQTPAQKELLRKYCRTKPYNKCGPPCAPNIGFLRDTCEYKPKV